MSEIPSYYEIKVSKPTNVSWRVVNPPELEGRPITQEPFQNATLNPGETLRLGCIVAVVQSEE